MTALADAQRFFWLEGLVTADDPIDLLRQLATEQHPRFAEQLVSQNRALKAQIADLELQLQSAKAHTSYLEVALQNSLDHPAQRQTSDLGSTSSMQKAPSPEARVDRLVDPSFVPCRDERCQREGLHQEHSRPGLGRGPRKRKETDA